MIFPSDENLEDQIVFHKMAWMTDYKGRKHLAVEITDIHGRRMVKMMPKFTDVSEILMTYPGTMDEFVKQMSRIGYTVDNIEGKDILDVWDEECKKHEGM